MDGSEDYAQKAVGQKAVGEGFQLMNQLDHLIDEFDIQLGSLEERLGPVLMIPEPESEMAQPQAVPLNNLHAGLERLSDRLTKLKKTNDRIRL